jgi:actin-related protein 3
MTSGGKPVYVRYGDEIDLASFLATLAAIMEKFSMYFSTDKQKSSFQKVVQNNYTILFIQRKSLYYICSYKRSDSNEFLI